MTSVVLVTPVMSEMCTPGGLYTDALARSCVDAGHEVQVVCAMSPATRPTHERTGRLTIHRLAPRRGSPGLALAVLAARRVLELSRSGRRTVIECIDAPGCAAALAAMRNAGLLDATIIAVEVDPDLQADISKPAAEALCDASINAGHRGSTDAASLKIPPPIRPGVWSPPAINAPALVACDAISDESRRFVLEAYRGSAARARGWSLALIDSDGRWRIERGDLRGAHTPPMRIVISISNAAPVAPMLALSEGIPCIFSDRSPLAAEPAAARPCRVFKSGDRQSLAETIGSLLIDPIHDSDLPEHDPVLALLLASAAPGEIVKAHQRVWSIHPTRQSPTASVRIWRYLEEQAAAMSRAGASI